MTASSSSSSKSLSNPLHTSQQNSRRLVQMQTPHSPVPRGGSSRQGATDSCARDALRQRNVFPDFHPLAQHRSGGAGVGGCDARDSVSLRKDQKAGREKLRRDRLNEQIFELRGALEPDQLKTDKFTILGDAIEALKDLTSEVGHLRAENVVLSDESYDLTQEKEELQDEKSLLKASVEQLQRQLQQQMNAMISWMTVDSAVMNSVRAFPYSVPPPPNGSSDADSQHSLAQGQVHIPFVAPGPFIPVPFLLGSPAMHTAMQGYYQLGDRVTTCFPYPYNLSLVPSHVERPFAHIPPPMQPHSGYPSQICRNPVTSPMHVHSQSAAYYQPYSFWPPQCPGPNPENLEEPHAGAERTEMPLSHPELPDECPASVTDNEDSSQNVPTTLQLQTPSFCLTSQRQEPQQSLGNLDQFEEQSLIVKRRKALSHGENSSRDSRIP